MVVLHSLQSYIVFVGRQVAKDEEPGEIVIAARLPEYILRRSPKRTVLKDASVARPPDGWQVVQSECGHVRPKEAQLGGINIDIRLLIHVQEIALHAVASRRIASPPQPFPLLAEMRRVVRVTRRPSSEVEAVLREVQRVLRETIACLGRAVVAGAAGAGAAVARHADAKRVRPQQRADM